MAKLERRLPSKASSSYFLQFARNITSQGGEDGILEELFRLLEVEASTTYKPVCIDIGAWDGRHLSNTYTLLYEKGWSGLLVEANELRWKEMQQLYCDRPDVQCACSLVTLEGPSSLCNILDEYNVRRDVAFLSIDIDGADYHLWRSVGSRCRSLVVCIEFNPTITNDVYFVQPPTTEVHQGSSLLALIELGKELGYTVVATTLFNAIFVLDEKMHMLPVIDSSIDALHVPHMSTSMFQTYEGELKFVGAKKLLWHKLSLNPDRLQLLPKKERKFPFAPASSVEDPLIKLREKVTTLGKCADCAERGDCGEGWLKDLEQAVEGLGLALRTPALEGIAIELMSNFWFTRRDRVIAQVGLAMVAMLRVAAVERCSAQPFSAEKLLRSALVMIRCLAARDDSQSACREEVEVVLALARALRLQERLLEAWELLEAWNSPQSDGACNRSYFSSSRKALVEADEELMARLQKESRKCHWLLTS